MELTTEVLLVFVLTDSGRVIKISVGERLSELVDGVWGDLRSPLYPGELWEEGGRELSDAEVANLVKSGKAS